MPCSKPRSHRLALSVAALTLLAACSHAAPLADDDGEGGALLPTTGEGGGGGSMSGAGGAAQSGGAGATTAAAGATGGASATGGTTAAAGASSIGGGSLGGHSAGGTTAAGGISAAGGTSATGGTSAAGGGHPIGGGSGSAGASSGTAGSNPFGGSPGAAGTSSGTGGSMSTGAPTADDLLALVASCNKVGGQYATDDGEKESVSICGLKGAVVWTADMDVDCDGKKSSQCSSSTDPDFQNQTSFTDSKGGWLDAANLPYVVVPLPSSRWDYMKAGVKPGAVVAVIYNGKLVYGVFGDEGPDNIIGESSYAMAKALGIDPDPSSGGTDGPVTYIVFLGDSAVQDPIEDHAGASALGEMLATDLIKNN